MADFARGPILSSLDGRTAGTPWRPTAPLRQNAGIAIQSLQPMPPEVAALATVLAACVGDAPPRAGERLDWAALDPQAVVSAAVRHRVVGLVANAPDSGPLPGEAVAALRRRHRRQLIPIMRQAAELGRLLDAFDAAGIEPLLVKGHAFSQLAYGDWTARGTSADADFLVSPRSIAAVHQLMLNLGFECQHDAGHVAPIKGWRGRYNEWLHYERFYTAIGQSAVDVHWRPVPGSAPWTSFDAITADRAQLTLHGLRVATPGPETALRIAAGQGEGDGWPNLRSAVDVLAAARLLPPRQLTGIRRVDPLVDAALNSAAQVLSKGNATWLQPPPHRRFSQLQREWNLRLHTDRPSRAVARSILGMWLPARQLTPRDPHTSDSTRP